MTPEIVEQMLATARAGKTVAYFGTHKSISEVFPMVIDTAGQALWHKVTRSAGKHRITYINGGKILFLSTNLKAGRGVTAQLVVLDRVSDAVAHAAHPCIATGGRVVRLDRWYNLLTGVAIEDADMPDELKPKGKPMLLWYGRP